MSKQNVFFLRRMINNDFFCVRCGYRRRWYTHSNKVLQFDISDVPYIISVLSQSIALHNPLSICHWKNYWKKKQRTKKHGMQDKSNFFWRKKVLRKNGDVWQSQDMMHASQWDFTVWHIRRSPHHLCSISCPLHSITFFPSALPFFDEAIVLSGRPGSIIAPMRLDCMTAADDTGHQKFRQSIKQTVA